MSMSSIRKTIGLTLALIGVVIAVMGLAILLDVAGSKEWTAYTLIALAVFMLIYGALVAYYLDRPKNARAPAEAAPVAPRRAGSYVAEAEALGEGRLADAIKFGAAKLDAKVAAGTMSRGTADAYFDKLMSYAPKNGTPEEDAALVSVSQLIGAITKTVEKVDLSEAHDDAHGDADGSGRKLVKAPKQKKVKPKKVKAAKPAKVEKAAAPVTKGAVASVYATKAANVGSGKLADSIKYGAAKIDAKVAAGVMSQGTADMFYGKLMAYAPKIGTPEEEATLVLVSQLIGGINDYSEDVKAANAKAEAAKAATAAAAVAAAAAAKAEEPAKEKPAKVKEEKPAEKAPEKAKPVEEKPVEKPAAKVSAGGFAAKPIKAGTGRLADAIKYGAQRLDARVGAGEIDEAAADAFFDKLVSFAPKAGTDGEEAALVSVAQIISAINRA